MGTKTLSAMIIGALAVILVASSVYIVPEYNKAVVLRFGEAIKFPEPGLHFKVPIADKVRQFDGRILTLDAPENSFYTAQNKQLVVDSFAKWQVTDAVEFYRSTGGNIDATNSLLLQRINDSLGNEIGRRTLHEVVSGKRDQLMEDLVKDVNRNVARDLGVDVIDVRVKRIDLPSEVSKSVFNRMVSARGKEAQEYRSQGTEQAQIITADADRQVTVIEANAYRDEQLIRGEGDAKAAATYAEAFSRDPEFYAFVRSLEAYQKSFSNKGDLMLIDPESDFFRYLKDATPDRAQSRSTIPE